jgi:hypothetical protein
MVSVATREGEKPRQTELQFLTIGTSATHAHAVVIRRLGCARMFAAECGFPVIYFVSNIFFARVRKLRRNPSREAVD